jgi:hypothetical protein
VNADKKTTGDQEIRSIGGNGAASKQLDDLLFSWTPDLLLIFPAAVST